MVGVRTIIVLDANIVVASPLLRDRIWQSLIAQRDAWDVRLVVPEVALLEAVKNVRARWEEKRAELAPHVRSVKTFGHDTTLQEVVDDIGARIQNYDTAIHERLTEIDAEIIAPPQGIDVTDLVRRAIEGRAPFGSGDKDCFRDGLIWCSVLELAQENPGADVWFVSNNTHDFGPAGKRDWTGPGTGTREDCPILFHADFVEELDRLELSDRVRYVTNIGSLEQHLAAQFAPISSEDLLAKLDDRQLAARVNEAAFGMILDPYATALDPGTETATVAMMEPISNSWVFLDGAGRGGQGWTARFTVVAEIAVASTVGSVVDVMKKTLNFAGDVAVSADGQVTEIEVNAAAALPDDPMRKAWPDPAQVARAYETSLRTSNAMAQLLNNSSPYENQARLMAEVEILRAEAASANQLLQSPSVRRMFGEISGNMHSAENFRLMVAQRSNAMDVVSSNKSALTSGMGALQTATDLRRIFAESAGTGEAAEKIRRTFGEVAGTAQTSENIGHILGELTTKTTENLQRTLNAFLKDEDIKRAHDEILRNVTSLIAHALS